MSNLKKIANSLMNNEVVKIYYINNGKVEEKILDTEHYFTFEFNNGNFYRITYSYVTRVEEMTMAISCGGGWHSSIWSFNKQDLENTNSSNKLDNF